MSQHVPEISTDRLGDDIYRRRLEGIFHACRCLRDAEFVFSEGESPAAVAETVPLRDCFQAALHLWVEFSPPEDDKTLPVLRTLLELKFLDLGDMAYARALAAKFLEMFDGPSIPMAAQLATFHEWGRNAGMEFWEHHSTAGHMPAAISNVVLDMDQKARMSYDAGIWDDDHSIIVPVSFLKKGAVAFDCFRWYMLLPFLFTHEYVSHILPTEIEADDDLFREGWLVGTAGGFLLAKNAVLEMPRTHALAYDEFLGWREIDPPAQVVALASGYFYSLCQPPDLERLMHHAGQLAFIPESLLTPWQQAQCGRYAALMRLAYKIPGMRFSTANNVRALLDYVWDSSALPEKKWRELIRQLTNKLRFSSFPPDDPG
jgi:hypothetical protein